MTVACQPLSVEDALRHVLTSLGPKQAAAIVGRDPHYVRSLANPQSRYRLSVADKIQLDLAYDEKFGGFPIHDATSVILDARRARQTEAAASFAIHVADAALETGQAIAAMIAAAMPNATPDDRREAAREWQEAQAALTRCGPVLYRMLTGPSP